MELGAKSVLFAVVVALCCGACRRSNGSGPQDDFSVRVPGVLTHSDAEGLSVRAPLGIRVDVNKDGVAVNAPGVVTRSDANGLRVRAPLGIRIDVDDAGVLVKAPGVRVATGPAGLQVDAPLVRVRTGAVQP